MDATMTWKSDVENQKFDRAMIDAFNDDPACGAFGEIEELRRRRMMNEILAATPRVKTVRESEVVDGRGTAAKRLWIAAAVIVGLIGAGLLVKEKVFSASKDITIAETESYFGEVFEENGNIFMDGRLSSLHAPIPVGKSIRTQEGNARLRLPTGIEWWMSGGSTGKIESAGEQKIDVAVLNGENWFRVDPTREGPAFTVKTPLGKIHVTGTIFVVRTTPEDVTVALLKGEVWVTRNSNERNLVKTGYLFHLSDGTQSPLSDIEEQYFSNQRAKLAWGTMPPSGTPKASSRSFASKSGVRKNMDRTAAMEAWTGNQDIQRIHSEIQSQRRRGNWEKVAALYQQIIQIAPSSEAALVSRVSLGDVYLTRLHRYNDALLHFNRYIRSGKRALLPEAMYGKCLVLKSLGRTTGEQKCLDIFIRKFPDSFQVAGAKERKEALLNEINH